MGAVVDNYGWTGVAALPSAGFLIEPVVAELTRLGAKRVIDMGCGNGAMSHLLQSRGFEVTGCDADAAGVALARKTDSGARFVQASFFDSPDVIGELGFDAAISTEVIEHLFQPRTLPHFAAKVLKPGGRLIISTPYHGYLKNLVIAALGKWDWHHTVLTDGGHIKFWSRATLTYLLEECGFSVERFQGAGRCPYLWKSMILTARLGR